MYRDNSSDEDDDDYDEEGPDRTNNNEDEFEDEAEKIYEEIINDLPADSSLARKRVLKTTGGIYSRKKSRSSRSIREKSALDRKRQFPTAPLKVIDRNLICSVCDAILSLKISTIKAHLLSKAHMGNLELKDKSQKTLTNYSSVIKGRESALLLAGSTLPVDTLAYRMKVTHALLKSGLCFSVLDYGSEIRALIEDGHCTVNKDSCASFIPVLNEVESNLTKEEMRAAGSFSICSDGTMNVAECLAIVSDCNNDSLSVSCDLRF